jgi:hypothetical protein
VDEPCYALELLVLDLLRPIELGVIVGVKAGVEEERRNAFLQERPLIASSKEVSA